MSALRIESTRIKPLEAESLGAGRNADVVRAKLEPVECSTRNLGESRHVAVKKMRVDDDVGDTPVLTVRKTELCVPRSLSQDLLTRDVDPCPDVSP